MSEKERLVTKEKKEKKKDEENSKEAKKKKESKKDALADKNLDIEENLNEDNMEEKDQIRRENTIENQRRQQAYPPYNQLNERCEGCFEGMGICFCVSCEKIFCKMCEDQIHIVPSNRNHERVPIDEIHHMKKLCYHHNLPLKLYCESCEEPICHECQVIGPHNNRLHKITNIFESFRKKFNGLNNVVQKNLIYKLEELMNTIGIFEAKIEEVKSNKNAIEREIRAEYSSMIENLRSEEGKKLAILQYESGILQKEINKIHEIVSQINEINQNDNPDMVNFLLKYKLYHETIEESLSKPIKKNIDISTDDLPRELDQIHSKLQKYELLIKALKVKDDIIWSLISEKKTQESNEINYIREKSHNEIAGWAKLADKYALELKRYYLVCHFCGCFLDDNVINSLCLKNSNTVKPEERGAFTINTISQEYLNTKRHFFGTPKLDVTAINHNASGHTKNIKDLNVNEYIENLGNSEIRDPYYFTGNFILNKNQHQKVIQMEVTENDIKNIVEKFYKISKKIGFEIEDSLNKCFKDKRNGVITNEMISFYLNSKFDLEEIELKKILIFFSDIAEDKDCEFKYDEFFEFVKKYLEEKNNKDFKKTARNPFENNIYNMNETYNQFSVKYNSRERSKSPPTRNRYNEESFKLEKASNEWVFKAASAIEKQGINLYRVLLDYDTDGDGYVTPDELRMAFNKIQVKLTAEDLDSMFRYFNISNMSRISVKDFAQNFAGSALK